MAETKSFYFHFRRTLLLMFFSGIDIPGISVILPKHIPRISFCVPQLILLYSLFEYSLNAILLSDDVNSIMYMMMINFSLLSLWSVSIIFSFFLRRSDLRDLISTWNHDFQPELWPELRDFALNWQKVKNWQKISVWIKYYLFPLTIGMIMVVLKGDYFMPTMFLTGHHEKPPRLLLLFQTLPTFGFTLWHAMLHYFISTFMRLIFVELEYVELSLAKLFSTIQMGGDGTLYSSGKITRRVALRDQEHIELCHEAEQRLFKLISYHSKILKFAHKVEKVFGLFLFTLIIMHSAMASAYLYGVTAGMIPENLGLLLSVAEIQLMALFLLNCTIGGKLHEKSSRCMDAAFYGNWMAYPVRIQKLLIPMIAVAKQRPITIKPFGLVSIERGTFYSMVSFQYKFYAFITDTLNK